METLLPSPHISSPTTVSSSSLEVLTNAAELVETESGCDVLVSDDEKPLDMSIKKYRHSSSSSSSTTHSAESYESQPLYSKCGDSSSPSSPPNSLVQLLGQQMTRPSVITCAPSLLSARPSPQSSAHPSCSPPPYSAPTCQNCSPTGHNSNSLVDDCRGSAAVKADDSGRASRTCKRHRCETGSGISDPVIDEHFRRSLGKDYSQIFSSAPNNASITVDDHFAKALGETWIRLQKTSRIEETSKTNCHNNAQSIAS